MTIAAGIAGGLAAVLVLLAWGSDAVPVLALMGALLGCLGILRGIGRGGQP